MFRKFLCLVLSLSVFVMTMPIQAVASDWSSDVIEIGQEVDFQPILDWTVYTPPAPGRDEVAYFAATDSLGRLWDIDVNLTKAKVTYSADDGTIRVGGLTPDGVQAFRTASNLSTKPENRTQCYSVTVCAVIVGVLVLAVFGETFYANAQCYSAVSRQTRIAGDETDRCNTEMANGLALGKRCSMMMTRQEASIETCVGAKVTCSVSCSDSGD